jgi:hypothetical protein
MDKFNTAYVRKIVKDNALDIKVKGRSNGMISVYPMNYADLGTLQELIGGMGYKTLLNLASKWYNIYAK